MKQKTGVKMTNKYYKISKLSEDTKEEIVKSKINWMRFLETAGHFYKYSFEDQVLIYAQRPDATACASVEIWNTKMNCWINKGAKGIALIDADAVRPKLKYVFDISDVHKAERIGRFPVLWEMKSEFEEIVLDSLKTTYEIKNNENSFSEYIKEIADQIVQECGEGAIQQVQHFLENSFLEKLDESNLSIHVREMIKESISYMILLRCGANKEELIEKFSFTYLHEFNTIAVVSAIGDVINEQVKPILIQIGKVIRTYKIEERDTTENLSQKRLEKKSDLCFNTLKGKSEEQVQQNTKRNDLNKEGRKENEYYLSSRRGLSDTRHRDGRGREATAGTEKIRLDEESLSEGTPAYHVCRNDSDRGTVGASVYHTGTGGGENGTFEYTDGRSRRSERSTQGTESDALGSENEQYSTTSRGNRIAGTDIQLNREKQESDGEKRSDSFFSEQKEDYQQFNLFSKPDTEKADCPIVYHHTLNYAVEHGELDEYRVSRKLDKECKQAVVDAIRQNYNGLNLNKEVLNPIVEEYGSERLAFILANTLQQLPWDGRFSKSNKVWAEKLHISEDIVHGMDMNKELIVRSHPAVLDGFINLFRREVLEWKKEADSFIQEESQKELADTLEQDVQKRDFHIINYTLGLGGAKEKFHKNIEAIHVLEKIEQENRIATLEEQEILSQYVGWGGLSDAFDERKANWTKEYQELKNLLSSEEYVSARESTLNAHYTNPVIIQGIYHTIERMGFSKGNILEPAMGIGNFFGMLPEEMRKSRLYGVELDSLTGRIAKQLYPNANIQITGFEKTEYPNDFFDIVVGNVPFGQYKVVDKIYEKQNFLVHDYFLAKSLDKVRSGGIVAVITSKGTMDKKNSEVRKYLAQRAELLGAVRLPNTAFKGNAGTEVTSDILFLQKRDRIIETEPLWIQTVENTDGILINRYFAEHPEMVVGKMQMVSGAYGMESTCIADTTRPFEEQLKEALEKINGTIIPFEIDLEEAEEIVSIPAIPSVKNYSYTIIDNRIYYRENSIMKQIEVPENMNERIKGMVLIRDCVQELIRMQLEEYADEMIKNKQIELNEKYDAFSKKFGLLNSQTNKRAFHQDSSYCLLCSLEKLNEDGTLKEKADMFSKRTIKKRVVVTCVDTASEALAVSLNEKAKIDFTYISQLTGKKKEEVIKELSGVIFQDPATEEWQTANEYLSGNVREKLAAAKIFAKNDPNYTINVEYLEKVQPKELEASEIEARLGATWIDKCYIDDFIREVFQTPEYLLRYNTIKTQFSKSTGEWNIKGKNADHSNPIITTTYGTDRVNAYKILEDSLNLRDTKVYDTIFENNTEKRILNKKETILASQKQEAMREEFKNWIFRDSKRRELLCKKYNELFNSIRPREYDGSHLEFPGMTPEIALKPHQKNAVAHILYGNNTLLAHCVGAGKTFEMVAAAMESKRLGLCQKSLFVVPNHLTDQWGSDFLRLYPGANILVATKKDFEPTNRKKFCARIATGNYDAVIIGHSQYEKIPLSIERQKLLLEKQIEEIIKEAKKVKEEHGERYTIKQLEKTRKSLDARLKKLNDQSKKDDVVTFEQLGIDRLFVDESHSYKNLFLYTKMRNVAGITQTEAQKSSDMFAKCQYLDELTGGKGITFATGTPISNSMTELYTNMRYLQYHTLQQMGLGNFDAWAATFGETQTAIELAPEGTGYRTKTRFAKFFNLPELITLFKECADIQTSDMLKLPIPEAEYHNVVLKPSEHQKEMVKSLAERAEVVRNRQVEATMDNMLRITNDGRKLALDQRLINVLLPDEEVSKVNACVENAFQIWKDTIDKKSTQLIFCDLSIPKGDGTFNVYEDIKDKLVKRGVPEQEITFIHTAHTEVKKAELFAKVRSGQVRFLLGSTAKMGAGTNVQDKLIALHHLDVPWRPSDIEQQEGRILRQGNINDKVKIFRYVMEGTFDSYNWQLIENKQKFIGQIMTSKSPVRFCEDMDEVSLSYAEVKALATGNPYIREKMNLDVEVSKLKLLKANHTTQIYRLEDDIAKHYPQKIQAVKEQIEGLQEDIFIYERNKPLDKNNFSIKLGNHIYIDKKEAGTILMEMCQAMKKSDKAMIIGEYQGFQLSVFFEPFFSKFIVNLKGKLSHKVEIGTDAFGNLQRIHNSLESMPKLLLEEQEKLASIERQLESAKIEVKKPFLKEAELTEKLTRLNELNTLLNMDEKIAEIVEEAIEFPEPILSSENYEKKQVEPDFTQINKKQEKSR